MIVYAETNFILEMGYSQAENEFCEAIIELAENHQIALVIPSFSVGESYETSYRREKERESFVNELKIRQSQLSYSTERDILADHIQSMIGILTQSIQWDLDRLRRSLIRVAGVAEFISLGPSSLTLAQEYQRSIRMEPPDSSFSGQS